MGLVSRILVGTYRYLRYGKQIGHVAKNGTKVYGRAGATTAINAEGKIVRTTQKAKTSEYQYRTKAQNYLPFGKVQRSETSVIRDGKNWQSTFRHSDSKTVPGGTDMVSANRYPDGTTHVTTDRAVLRNGHPINHRTESRFDKDGNLIDFTM